MKSIILVSGFLCLAVAAFSQTPNLRDTPDSSKKTLTAEVSCGKCQFHMKDKDCHLAVRIDGKSYWVDGADIDSFGDAHANDGFCKAIRKAEVQGEIVNNRFKASYIKLLPPATK